MNYRSLLAIISALTLLISCKGENKKNETADKEDIPVVKVMPVETQNVEQVFTYTASTEADKINNISSSMPLRIENILVDEGQRVAAGQRVVILDDVNTTSYELQVSTAEAQLRNAQVEYNRALELFKIGGGTKQAVDQMETQLINARNAVASAKRALANAQENRVLTSPVSGVVTARNYDPGDMTGSLPILTVAQVQPIKIMINVSESEFTLIRTGMKADITLDPYGDEAFTGTISKMMPTVDPNTRTFGVEITLPNPGNRVLPGMFGRVSLTLGEANHIVVPDRAVVKQQGSGNHYIYVYDSASSTVDYRQVELGQRLGTNYEVISGIEPGSQVVISGQNALANGKKVQLQK